MNKNRFLKITNEYKSRLEDIISRFTESRDSLDINTEDDPIYRQIVLELMDFIYDSLPNTTHSEQIRMFFIEGTANYLQSPSYKSIEDIIGVIGAVITRVKRNPDLLNKKKKSDPIKKDNLDYTEKVTFSWLRKNVPAKTWLWFFSIMVLVFCLGANTTAFKPVRDFLNIFPWYDISYEIPIDSQKVIKSQIESLTNAHNQRLAELQKNLIEEVRLSGDHFISSDFGREAHKESADTIRALITDENENYNKELNHIEELLK